MNLLRQVVSPISGLRSRLFSRKTSSVHPQGAAGFVCVVLTESAEQDSEGRLPATPGSPSMSVSDYPTTMGNELSVNTFSVSPTMVSHEHSVSSPNAKATMVGNELNYGSLSANTTTVGHELIVSTINASPTMVGRELNDQSFSVTTTPLKILHAGSGISSDNTEETRPESKPSMMFNECDRPHAAGAGPEFAKKSPIMLSVAVNVDRNLTLTSASDLPSPQSTRSARTANGFSPRKKGRNMAADAAAAAERAAAAFPESVRRRGGAWPEFDGEWAACNPDSRVSKWLLALRIEEGLVIDGNGDITRLKSGNDGVYLHGGLIRRQGDCLIRTGRSGRTQVFVPRKR